MSSKTDVFLEYDDYTVRMDMAPNEYSEWKWILNIYTTEFYWSIFQYISSWTNCLEQEYFIKWFMSNLPKIIKNYIYLINIGLCD